MPRKGAKVCVHLVSTRISLNDVSNPAFRQTINIRDETPGNLSFTLFAEDRRNDWLPGLKLQLGHSILIRGIKVWSLPPATNNPSSPRCIANRSIPFERNRLFA